MTKVLNMYSFMDLLKDYDYVPEAAAKNNEMSEKVSGMVEYMANLIKVNTTDYDFMDLLANNGFTPVNGSWEQKPSNDNIEVVDLAS